MRSFGVVVCKPYSLYCVIRTSCICLVCCFIDACIIIIFAYGVAFNSNIGLLCLFGEGDRLNILFSSTARDIRLHASLYTKESRRNRRTDTKM